MCVVESVLNHSNALHELTILTFFSFTLHTLGPPNLPCDDPPAPVPPSGFGNLNFGCDMCIQPGQSVIFLTLDCTPDTKRLPTNCTIRNPDGITSGDLDDGAAFVSANDQLTISYLVSNPEDPDPPTVLGNWTCTCVNADGVTTATSKIGECCKLVSFSAYKGNHALQCSVL